MKYANKNTIFIALLLVTAQSLFSVNKITSMIDSFAYNYNITEKGQKEFLKKVAEAKDSEKFLNDHKKYIANAPKRLIEAAYWLAEKVNPTLAYKLLEIADSK